MWNKINRTNRINRYFLVRNTCSKSQIMLSVYAIIFQSKWPNEKFVYALSGCYGMVYFLRLISLLQSDWSNLQPISTKTKHIRLHFADKRNRLQIDSILLLKTSHLSEPNMDIRRSWKLPDTCAYWCPKSVRAWRGSIICTSGIERVCIVEDRC